MRRTVRFIIVFLLLTIAGLYIRESFFIIRNVSVRTDPATIYPDEHSLLSVCFLNSMGGKVPFAHRKVEFEIVEGGEHCTLEDAHNPDAISIHAISPGEVTIHVHVDGFALPFEVTVHIREPIG
ncbi:MAG TPA: hypothetical protein VFA55_09525 [Candidatus Kapabacteria bacterium]|nr:hypothetical protein [Candidatus Kapabacteria bacterium]